jgi:hypothetical protein
MSINEIQRDALRRAGFCRHWDVRVLSEGREVRVCLDCGAVGEPDITLGIVRWRFPSYFAAVLEVFRDETKGPTR